MKSLNTSFSAPHEAGTTGLGFASGGGEKAAEEHMSSARFLIHLCYYLMMPIISSPEGGRQVIPLGGDR